jgi:glycosyltransferase involved in cell wall biosynthesis
MKIGIYNPRAGTRSAGGTETFLREIIKRCDETVELFTGEGTLLSEVAESDVTVHQIPLCYKEHRVNELIATYTPVLSAEVESVSMFINCMRSGIIDQLEACDVVSTHYYADNLLLSRVLDVPTVFRFAGIKNPSIRWRTMFAVGQADAYVANSESTAERLAEWYDTDVLETVYAGVDVEKFTPNKKPDTDEFVVLFVGRLDDGKGIPDLIRAVRNMDVQLRIVGDGNRRNEFESTARQHLESDRYEFIGEVPHDEVHAEYQMADLFCLPSYHESFGIVILEALACGLPVVTTDLDAITEYAEDGENALLFEPGDVSALEKAIRRLVDSEALRNRLSQSGRETALQYSWLTQTEKMTNVYRQLAEQDE